MWIVTSRGDNEEVVCVEGQVTQEICACMRVHVIGCVGSQQT